jgi:hypothetical protein
MARTNIPPTRTTTHEGATAKSISPELQLRRSVMACLLWEDGFYESGTEITTRISNLIPLVPPKKVAQIAISCREEMKLRHVPLFIVKEMAKLSTHKHLVARTLYQVIQRPDELTEFLALYWKADRCPLSAQVKRGLAMAFPKFNEYQLAKYNRDNTIKLRDVLFLCHAKPQTSAQDALWKRVISGDLQTPDTWEVKLSSSADKRESWETLLRDRKLGALALLRNLRNMSQAQVDRTLIQTALVEMSVSRVLPYRFIAAARYAPIFEPFLEVAMFKAVAEMEKLPGRTVFLIDVSGSMDWVLNQKSDLNRIDAACGLAILGRELCNDCEVFTFSNYLRQVPARRGFALRDAINQSQPHSGTDLGGAVRKLFSDHLTNYDRLIILTDEQSHTPLPDPPSTIKAYMINVANYQQGLGYHAWTHIDGWSEASLRFIQEIERLAV